MTKFLYRYVDVQYASPIDEFDNVIGEGRFEVRLDEYPILKTTPRGDWIDLGGGSKKFVRFEAIRHFACRTPELAKESFKARKARQIKILSAQLRRVEKALRVATNEGSL